MVQFRHSRLYLRTESVSYRLLQTTAIMDMVRGTQRQFLKNICSEDDLRSRIFGTLVVKFLAASPRIFEHLKYGIIAYF